MSGDHFIGRHRPTVHTQRPQLRQNQANDTMEEIVFAYVRSHADLDDTEAAAFLKDLAAHPDLHRTYALFLKIEKFARRAVELEKMQSLRARKQKRSAKETEALVREYEERVNHPKKEVAADFIYDLMKKDKVPDPPKRGTVIKHMRKKRHMK
jgi:hypothetical protein